jgi:hypothetical protein
MKAFKKALFELGLPPAVKKDVIALGIAKKHWQEVIGKELAPRSRPYCVSRGTLVVEVEDSVLAQVISLHASFYLDRLNEKAPPRLRPLFKALKTRINPDLEEKKALKKRKLGPEESASYLGVCDLLEDRELKEVFEGLMRSYLKALGSG